MKHIVEEYKEWQPKYAAYNGWTDKRKRQEQAIGEMICEALEVKAIEVKASRKGLVLDRAKVVDELGDTFWGLVGVMNEFDITFEEMINYNMDKLNARNVESNLDR
jgi:NTP pyrophosphatase (non-canonical NTP hydrolase)